MPHNENAKVTLDNLREIATYIRHMTLIAEDSAIRPASMSYVRPSEYRQNVNRFLDGFLSALPTPAKVTDPDSFAEGYNFAKSVLTASPSVEPLLWRIGYDTKSGKRHWTNHTESRALADIARDEGYIVVPLYASPPVGEANTFAGVLLSRLTHLDAAAHQAVCDEVKKLLAAMGAVADKEGK